MKNVVGAIIPHQERTDARDGLLAVRSGARLVPHRRPEPETANAYLRLTAHLLVEAGLRRFRTIGVVSAASGEGRTTAALNLAICFGRTRGRAGRVLLVDGDVRRPRLSEMLADGGGTPPGMAPEDGIRTTPFEGVDFLPAPRSADPLALDTPLAWVRRIHELGGRYAHVVVDCPSLLDSPDGYLLGECVDGLVLVVHAGRTAARSVERATAGFEGRILGVILNGGRAAG